MKKRLFIAAIVLALAGCGGAAGNSDMTGSWEGTGEITSNGVVTPITLKGTLAQSGSASTVTGSLAAESSSGTSAWTVDGTFNGSALTATLLPSDTTRCTFKVTLLYSDNRLSGTGSAYNCTVSESMEISLTR